MENLVTLMNRTKRSRLIVKKGLEFVALFLKDIVVFNATGRIVYAIDKHGKKYVVDMCLADLESKLDEQLFFRANRQYIINIDFVKGFKIYERVKLAVVFDVPDNNYVVIISQETAPKFRSWIYGA